MARAKTTSDTLIDGDTSAVPSPKTHPSVVDAQADVSGAQYAVQAARGALLAAEATGKRPGIRDAKQAARDAEKALDSASARLATAQRQASREAYAAAKQEHAAKINAVYDALASVQQALQDELTFRNDLASKGVDRRIMFKPTTAPLSKLPFLLLKLDVAACRQRLERLAR
jgi:flagellar hook-basal body complex protein FliE